MKPGIRFALVSFIACLVAGAAADAAAASTFRVNKLEDPAPGPCTRSHCTLREAVIAANSHSGADVVLLRSGKSYRLAIAGAGEDAAATGDLDITDSLTIKRAKPRALRERRRARKCPLPPLPCKGPLATVDANRIDGVFETHGSLNTVFNGLVIRRGNAGTVGHDGGIDVDDGTARVIGSVVTGNTGTDDGGIGTNKASLIVKRTRVGVNHGNGDVGGIDANGERLRLIRSLVFFNVGAGAGGGVFVSGEGLISKSELVGNGSDEDGAGLYNINAATTVLSSTFEGNFTDGGSGGAIASAGGTSALTVRNSTIANNGATENGGGIYRSGGIVALNNVTIARNEAQVDGLGGSEGGGGIATVGGPGFTLSNSLIALNTVGANGVGPNCTGSPFASGGHNLFGSLDAGCGLSMGSGDLINPNPKLERGKPFTRDHGGPTGTLALLKGSPAINKGGADAEKRDQRGVRKFKRRDIGAFEFVPKRRRR